MAKRGTRYKMHAVRAGVVKTAFTPSRKKITSAAQAKARAGYSVTVYRGDTVVMVCERKRCKRL